MRKIVLFLLFMAFFTFGDTNPAVVKDARKALATKNYNDVLEIYKSFADSASAQNDAFENLKPIYIEALTFLREFDKISTLSASFIAQYPASEHVARIYYLWGIAQANLGNYVQAIIAFDEGLKNITKDKHTEKSIRNTLELIVDKYLSHSDVNKLLQSGISGETANFLTTRNSNAKETKKESLGSGSINKTIGLLVPLTGEFSELGLSTVNTVKMVLSENEAETGEKIAIKVYDTEGNAVKTALKTRELLRDNISMVIGPVMSNTATVAAAILSQHPDRCVMITPTATDDGIALLGRNIFQINLTQKALAEKIANYAVEDLRINKFTILAPLNEYGKIMTEYFSSAVKGLGATVEFIEYFSPDASDHRKQFGAIRDYYANLKFGGTGESAEKMRYKSDSTIVLGGLFLPVSHPESAVQLAAQVPFHKIRTQILGASVWDNQRVINDGKTTVQNICFSAGQKIDTESESFKKFIQNYKAMHGAEPNLVVAPLVADAVRLMLKAYSQSASPADLSKNLLNINGYQGLSSEISFKNSIGVNTGAVVMKISGQKSVRVK